MSICCVIRLDHCKRFNQYSYLLLGGILDKIVCVAKSSRQDFRLNLMLEAHPAKNPSFLLGVRQVLLTPLLPKRGSGLL